MRFFAAKYMERVMSWGVFLLLFITYLLSLPETVSFWDCPEYVAGAWRLEIGHPPGNPFWMLTHRIVTIFVPGKYAALAINMASAFFTALTGMLLAKSLLMPLRRLWNETTAMIAAATAALCYGWCDSAWYSAVEAEVYAMSGFLSMLMLWLMLKATPLARRRLPLGRVLILEAYLAGLSLGVHQLNLLLIPVLGVIALFSVDARPGWKRITLAVAGGCAAVGCILIGMMTSTVALAGMADLITVNRLGMDFNSGAMIYLALLFLSAVAAIYMSGSRCSGVAIGLSLLPLIFLSGIFIFRHNLIQALILSAGAAVIAAVVASSMKGRRYVNVAVWMLSMLLAGYSVYLVVPLRGDVLSPANAFNPSDAFSLESYISRDLYGSKPLLYGRTSYSKPLLKARIDSAGKVTFHEVATESSYPLYQAVADKEGKRYRLSGHHEETLYTPELDMWFPRITGSSESDRSTYAEWIGMDATTMVEKDLSHAVDSAGNLLPFINGEGKCVPRKGFRPTYLQNLTWFGSYQLYYMYLRYLLWNFGGRQNDFHSTGQAEYGNFITGIPAVDDLMLGNDSRLPKIYNSGNAGRNRLFLVPFLFGIAGMVILQRKGSLGRKTNLVLTGIFILTGAAIVIYLNQTPNEPRERDYTFLVSYMAFAAWSGVGVTACGSALARFVARKTESLRMKRIIRYSLLMAGPAMCVWMLFVNVDDHDRSGRLAARSLAMNTLNSLDRDAVLFVDGDNFTFPFWYLQEVEGIRRDVRVVNMSYMTLPDYLLSLSYPYGGSRPLSFIMPRDLLGNRREVVSLKRSLLPDSLRMREMEATEALAKLYASGSNILPAGKWRFELPGMDKPMVIDIADVISENGGRSLPLRRLAMLDFIAANIESGNPRPVYWIKQLRKNQYAGLSEYTYSDLLTYRFGTAPTDSLHAVSMLRKGESLQAPMAPGKSVYFDETSGKMVEYQRGDVAHTASLLFRMGFIREAKRLALIADSVYGRPRGRILSSYTREGAFNTADSLKQLGVGN